MMSSRINRIEAILNPGRGNADSAQIGGIGIIIIIEEDRRLL